MKKKNYNDSSGITICDSIVMSVKKKRPDMRRPEAVVIAVIGFVSVIMSFLGMFEFNFNKTAFVFAAVSLSAVYITLSIIGKKALWVILGSVLAFAGFAYKMIDKLAEGFKFVYNIIYRDSYHTTINYYKFLKPRHEEEAVTIFFIFCIWLLAVIIYFFTIYHPNPLLPLLATFPILEAGLYNGIEIPIFWGVLTIGYWLAVLAMSTIDSGEFSGGSSGFVRKNDLFFPKRHMKLKVTEKCAMFVIASVMAAAGISAAVINISEYERSDEINRKRIEIRDAVNSFSIENLAESISRFTEVFGFSFKYENHKLGTNDRLKYKNTTDLIVTFDRKYDGAVYLKDFTGSVYGKNEWSDLPAAEYKEDIFGSFKNYNIYPQDFPCMFDKMLYPEIPDMTIWINSKLKENKSFSPYGTDNFGNLTYNQDMTVSSKRKNENEFSYKFRPISAGEAAGLLSSPQRTYYSAEQITDEYWKNAVIEYASDKDIIQYDNYNSASLFPIDSELPARSQTYQYNNGDVVMAQLLQEDYESFVYEEYLQVPDNRNMNEIREEFADILEYSKNMQTAAEKIEVLNLIRARIEQNTVYSLSPGKTPSNRDFVNYFLLENQKGYCTHYATSGVILARMAGIPARYATGYVIVADDFNDDTLNKDGSYTIDIKDSRGHAWAEIYLDGYGWVPFEFTAGYSDSSIVTTTAPVQEQTTSTQTVTTTEMLPSSGSETTASTTKNPSGGSVSRTTTSTTSVSSAAATKIVPHGNSGKNGGSSGFVLPKTVKNTLSAAAAVILIALMLLLRRFLILRRRRRKFTSGSPSERAGYMYLYAKKLLSSIKLKNEEYSYINFAEEAEQKCSGAYFRSGEFSNFVDIALRAGFSPEPPSNEELKFCENLVEGMSDKIYQNSGFFRKIYMKLISVIK